jgi:hypothetical protein
VVIRSVYIINDPVTNRANYTHPDYVLWCSFFGIGHLDGGKTIKSGGYNGSKSYNAADA